MAGFFCRLALEAAMLPPVIIEKIRRLLAEGQLSQRKIAHTLGVSRGVVGDVAAGRRPDYEALGRQPDDSSEPPRPPARCGECGGMVYLPCRLCEARRATGHRAEHGPSPRRPLRDVTEEEGPIELQLKEEHRRRYVEVRARREAAVLLGWPQWDGPESSEEDTSLNQFSLL